MIRRLVVAGSEYTGIRVAGAAAGKTIHRLFTGIKTRGVILMNGTLSHWIIHGITVQDDDVFIYGPAVDASHLMEVLAGAGTDAALKILANLAAAYALLEDRGECPGKLYPDGVFPMGGGGFLFLSGQTAERIASVHPEEKLLAGYYAINHPDLPSTESLSFSIAALSFRVLTGEFPFPGISGDAVRLRMRSLGPISPRHIRPDIKETCASILTRALSPGQYRPSAAEWETILRSWIREGPFERLSAEESETVLRREEKNSALRERRHRRREFFRRNRIRITLSALVLILAAYAATGIISGALRPGANLGLSPEEVVRLFYESMGRLDHAAMEDSVSGKAGDDYIREVTHLFVIFRMRQAVESRTVFLDAGEWHRSGRPAPAPGTVVYGAAGIHIEREEIEDSGGPVFRVSWERRIPGENPEIPSRGLQIEERVFTLREGSGPVIIRIDKLSETPLTGLGPL